MNVALPAPRDVREIVHDRRPGSQNRRFHRHEALYGCRASAFPFLEDVFLACGSDDFHEYVGFLGVGEVAGEVFGREVGCVGLDPDLEEVDLLL